LVPESTPKAYNKGWMQLDVVDVCLFRGEIADGW